MPTPRVWNIIAVRGDEGQRPVAEELLTCSIVLDENTNVWGFFGPRPAHTLEASVPPDANGNAARPPFNFPKFTSSLNGDIEKDWYIQLSTTEHTPLPDQATGYWSNTHFPIAGAGPEADPDTFTAQTGAGVGEDEGEAAAAAGSSNQ